MPDRQLTDFLQRLVRALPLVRQWIAALQATHGPHGIRASESGFPMLVQWFPPDLLERARTVATPSMLLHGYEQSPLETVAFELQAHVESGTPVPAVVEMIERHAIGARAEAKAVFRAQGLRLHAEPEPTGPPR